MIVKEFTSLGWKGLGLGKNEAGRLIPIDTIVHVNKFGLGYSVSENNVRIGILTKKFFQVQEREKKLKEVLSEPLKADSTQGQKPVDAKKQFETKTKTLLQQFKVQYQD